MIASSVSRMAPSSTAALQIRHVAATARLVVRARPSSLSSLLPRIVAPFHSVPRLQVCCAASVDDAPTSSEHLNRLFVGNLSYTTTAEGLGKHFAQVDGFVAANVAFDARRQLSKGFGFVEFSSPEAADRARQVLSETELDGRNLLVQPASPRVPRDRNDDRRGGRDGGREMRRGRGDRGDRDDFGGERRMQRERPEAAPGTRVFVSNLPYSINWQDVKDQFRSVGEVTFVDMLMKRLEDGRLVKRGSAIVAFTTPEAAEEAVDALNGVDVDGRAILVRMFEDDPR